MNTFRRATYAEVETAMHRINGRTISLGRPAGE